MNKSDIIKAAEQSKNWYDMKPQGKDYADYEIWREWIGKSANVESLNLYLIEAAELLKQVEVVEAGDGCIELQEGDILVDDVVAITRTYTNSGELREPSPYGRLRRVTDKHGEFDVDATPIKRTQRHSKLYGYKYTVIQRNGKPVITKGN